MKVALLPSIPPPMLSYPPSRASVSSHSDEAHGRDARAIQHGGQAWHGKQLSPKSEAGSPVAAVYDRRNDAVARSSAGFQPASAKEAGRDACATKIRILRIPSMSRVGDRTRTGGHRPPLQNSIGAQRDSTRSEWLNLNAAGRWFCSRFRRSISSPSPQSTNRRARRKTWGSALGKFGFTCRVKTAVAFTPMQRSVRLSPTREAALVLTLPAGAYTAIVETPNGTPGVGLVEIYQIS